MRIYIGYDEHESDACEIAIASIHRHATIPVEIRPVNKNLLGGLYRRPTAIRHGALWDVISKAPMSTSHALARFWIPNLMGYKGSAIFMDGDVLIRKDIKELAELADPVYAVQCVKQLYRPNATVKKSGDAQTFYWRKNWSSVMIFNCGHARNKGLTLEVLNSQPGLWLHEFAWLHDNDIGGLPLHWNYLVTDPALVHFTEGLPRSADSQMPYAQEWLDYHSREVGNMPDRALGGD